MEPTLPRTLFLRERTATECRLAAADVAFLLAEHANHLELLPTGRRGRYRLTPGGHVGVIVAPTCRLVIRPKIALADLFQLLDPAAPLPAVADAAAAVPGTEALDFLAGRLAGLLAERAAAGLHRAYAERTEQGPFLHGRLDVPAHLREPAGRKDRLHCRYEEFSADVPCNQGPRATGELLLRCPFVGDGARAALRAALQGFAGVQSVELGPDSFSAATAGGTPAPQAYRPLLDLCRLLADGLRPGDAAGPVPCPAFLIDMERVFERYVTAAVETAFAESARYRVVAQPLCPLNRPVPGLPDLHVRPDVVVERDGKPVLVVDAKWKRSGPAGVTADLYQVLAYGAALGVSRLALVYPGGRNGVRTYPLAGAPAEFAVHALRVVGPREACAHARRRLGLRLRRSGHTTAG